MESDARDETIVDKDGDCSRPETVPVATEEKILGETFNLVSIKILDEKICDGLPLTSRNSSPMNISLSPSPPPSLDLSVASTLSSTRNFYGVSDDLSLNDCSSSVSSQDSYNIASNTTTNPKMTSRSVFSQYWRKTGQKPLPIRSMRSPSFSSIAEKEPEDISSSSSCTSTRRSFRSSASELSEDHRILSTVSNADLLEDDQAVSLIGEESATKPPKVASPARRRSILPTAPASHPSLRRTSMNANTRSWRKTQSMTNVPDESPKLWASSGKAHANSMPRMNGSSALAPGASCLRPFQKYSSPRTSESGREGAKELVDPPSPLCLPPTQELLSRSVSSSSIRSSSSTTSSVSFLESVDVRHFEKPREIYAEKGWSNYFK